MVHEPPGAKITSKMIHNPPSLRAAFNIAFYYLDESFIFYLSNIT